MGGGFTQLTKRYVHCLFLLLLAGMGGGCGGGTAGTGGQRYDGTLRTTAGTPIVGATVTIQQTGDSSLSDQTGAFTIQTQQRIDDCTFDIRGTGVSGTAQLNDIPEQAERIDFDLSYDEDNGDFNFEDLNYFDDQEVEFEDDSSGDGEFDDGEFDEGEDDFGDGEDLGGDEDIGDDPDFGDDEEVDDGGSLDGEEDFADDESGGDDFSGDDSGEDGFEDVEFEDDSGEGFDE